MLPATAVAVVKEAMIAALQSLGGGVEPEDDPDLSPGLWPLQAALEHRLRAAYRLLDQPRGE